MLTRPYTPGWLMPIDTPTLVWANAGAIAQAASSPSKIFFICLLLFMCEGRIAAPWNNNAAHLGLDDSATLLLKPSASQQRQTHVFKEPDNSYTLARPAPTHEGFSRCLIATS